MSGRTMINGPIGERGATVSVDNEAYKLMVDVDKTPAVVEINGEQYAKLPEGWPAAEAKDLEEAHAEAVMADEPTDGMTDWERTLYAWTPEEVKELVHAYIATEQELIALRKGMKTMQRKSRKQTQQQRRLERRLAQARAGREQLRATASKLAERKLEDAVATLSELIEEKGLLVRGEPQANTQIDFDALAKEPRGFA